MEKITSFILDTCFAKKKAITLTSIFKTKRKGQKTSIGLGNFHVDNYN